MSSVQIMRRNPAGTKCSDFYNWPDQSFEEMDTTLAVQQYIQQTIRHDNSDIENILTAPEGQDEGVWKYEHLRQFCLELNGLAVKLQSECTAETCSQMTATEQWIFLCAAHKTPKECPAIDYTRHTLDGAACLLNSNKYFPSRVSIKESSVAKLGSVCRRVYRIFSHAYYHHRHIFDEFENETFLCRRFTVFVISYNLMSRDNLIVPILDDPSPKVVHGTSPVYTLASLTETIIKAETEPASQENLDDSAIYDSLSTTIQQAPADEEKTDDKGTVESQEEGFGHTGGTPDFATLRPQKSTEKKEPPTENSNNNSNVTDPPASEAGGGGDLKAFVGEDKSTSKSEAPANSQS